MAAGCISEEQSKIVGRWRLYESTNAVHTLSYDSTLCSTFDSYEDDPMEYQFFDGGLLLYANLGSCPTPSKATYRIEGNKLIILLGVVSHELKILRLDENELHWQKSAMELNTVEKFIRK